MRSFLWLSAAVIAFSTASLHAQAPAPGTPLPGVKVDFKRATVIEQPTPQFSGGVKEKRWRPKNWIEMDVEFEIKLPLDAGGNKGSYSGLKMNLYVALQHRNKEGKIEVLTGSYDLVNVPAGETCHLLAYISPATMKSIMQKDLVTASTDISAWGVEFFADNQRIEGKASVGAEPWWETKKDSFVFIQDGMLHKSKTPFAILWGDYDVLVQTK